MPNTTTNTETPETLKYEKGKFVLTEVSSSKLRLKLSRNANWKAIENDSYTTTDLGAAATFRKWADERVEKIFNRTFQSHYEVTPRPPFADLAGLDPTQVKGLTWVTGRKRSYLAHAPGAGKTAIAILAACLTKANGQVLFIVPPGLTTNWEREIYKFSPWVGNYGDVAVVPKSDRQAEMNWCAHFIICADSMMAKPWVYEKLSTMNTFKAWKFIAVDEASRFKEPTAERSLAFYGGKTGKKSFLGLFHNARHVVFLDGSPMPNRPIELWAPTYALHPEAIDCRDYDDFGYRYCGAKPNERGQWEYLYSSNEEELKNKLQKDFIQVVTEAELSHPERRRSMLFMSEDVRTTEHREWERRNLTKDFSANGEISSQGEIAHYRKQLGISKIPWVTKYVKERLLEKNESILLFAWHREVCLQLAANLIDWVPGVIIGGTPNSERETLFAEFQNGTRKLLILNILAGGRGHNLQRADRVIFAEWSWGNEVNTQAEKRASRKGSDKSFVRCEYIVAPDSMDEIVLRSVFTKEKRTMRIIG